MADQHPKTAITVRAAWGSWLAPMAVCAVLGSWALGAASMWLDEAVSASIARLGWADFFSITASKEANMSFYYAFLKLWSPLGRSDALLRVPSVVFAAASIPVLYALAVRLVDRRTATVACWLLAVNGFFLHYAHQTRGYTLVVLLAITSSLFLMRTVAREGRFPWLFFALVSAAAVYTHFFAGFVILAQLLALIIARPRAGRPLVLAYGSLAVLLSPLAAFLSAQRGGQIAWIPATTLRSVVPTFKALTGLGGRALLGAMFVLCALGVFAILREIRSARLGRWLILMWTVVPVAAVFAISLVVPILRPQYLIVVLPGLALLAAVGSRQLPGIAEVASVLVVVALAVAALPAMLRTLETHDWRGATRYVLAEAGSGDAIVFYAYYGVIPFSQYARRLSPDVRRATFPSVGWNERRIIRESPLGPAVDEIAATARVWLVLNNARTDRPTPELRSLLDRMAREFTPGRYREFKGGIRIREYVRTA